MAPLPANVGAHPVASRIRSRQRGHLSGTPTIAAGSRSFDPSLCGPTELVPRSVDDGCAHRHWRDDQGDVDRFERQRFDDLADPANRGTAADDTEGNIGAQLNSAWSDRR